MPTMTPLAAAVYAAMASQMLLATALATAPVASAAPAFIPQAPASAPTSTRARFHREHGRQLGDGKSKAQRDAEALARSIGYVGGRRVA